MKTSDEQSVDKANGLDRKRSKTAMAAPQTCYVPMNCPLRRPRPWRVVMKVLFFLAVFAFLGGVVRAVFFGGDSLKEGLFGHDEMPRLDEVWSSGQGSNKVVRIPLKGMILLEDGGLLLGGAEQTRFARACIQRAKMDRDVQGIILEVNSPGGGITASDIIYKALKDFRKSHPDRRIVVLMGDVAASGGYYVSLAADHIVAHPTTITGSIGVIIQSVNFHELAKKIGLKDQSIKSAEFKDMMNPMRPVDEKHRAVLQGIVNQMYKRFVGLVAEARGLGRAEAEALADGRVYTAGQALEEGLIDQIGYAGDATAMMDRMLGGDGLRVVRYRAPESVLGLLTGSGNGFAEAVDALKTDASPRLMYYWRP